MFDDPLTALRYTVSIMTDSITRPSLSYLLRLWAEEDGEAWAWRASLQVIPGQQALGFPSLEAAVAYLKSEMSKETDYNERTHPH